MSEIDTWTRHLPLKKLQRSLARLVGSVAVDRRQEMKLGGGKVRIPMDALPLRLSFGNDGTKLHVYPEAALAARGKVYKTGNVLITETGTGRGLLRREVRMTPGQAVTLHRDVRGQVILPGLSQAAGPAQLTVKVFADSLVLKNHQPASKIRVVPLEARSVARLVERRIAALRRLRRILGGPIEVAEPDAALETLLGVNAVLEREAHRPTDRRGLPGGVVSLPDRLVPVIIGDLHTRVDNLLAVLTRGGLLNALEAGRACLVILGDAVHEEDAGALEEMDSSLRIMDLILRLKLRFQDKVFYLRGNHDGFSDRIEKEGVPQGVLWRRALKQARGKRYRKEMERFYERIPYIAVSRYFLACHAGAPSSKVSRDVLINIRQYPALERELTENWRDSANRQRSYNKNDVKRFRKAMELGENVPFIVGHTPPSRDDTLWANVGEIAGHHLVYSGGAQWVGAVTLIDGSMVPLRYPAEPLLDLYNSLPSA
jgi:hypothetical protein